MSALNPLVKTCAIIVSSHRMPADTWSPWQPTSVKNADRNALRVGPAPPAIALLGLLGMLAGEQAISLVRSHVFKSGVQLNAASPDRGEAVISGDVGGT